MTSFAPTRRRSTSCSLFPTPRYVSPSDERLRAVRGVGTRRNGQRRSWRRRRRLRLLKVHCALTLFSGRFSHSTCTNDFSAATHNERRFQFRLLNRLFRVLPGFMGKSLVISPLRINKCFAKTRSFT